MKSVEIGRVDLSLVESAGFHTPMLEDLHIHEFISDRQIFTDMKPELAGFACITRTSWIIGNQLRDIGIARPTHINAPIHGGRP